MTGLTLTFHGDLAELLHPRWRKSSIHALSIDRIASIKDVIESLGLPHTEIDRLLVNNSEVDFAYLVQDKDDIDVYPPDTPVDPLRPAHLRPLPLQRIAFVVDINVAKLASLLRLLGFDTLFDNGRSDCDLASLSESEGRILLTRDTNLLKRKNVMHGHLVRTSLPQEQAKEVMRWYGLFAKRKPFSRCLACNGMLEPIEKETIIQRLEPLTKKYFFHFHICPDCQKIYWSGSHRDRMQAFIDDLEKEFSGGS